jgi:hypothetical protein
MSIWLVLMGCVIALLFVPVWAYRVGLRGSGEDMLAAGRKRLAALYRSLAFAAALFCAGWWLIGSRPIVGRGFGLLVLVFSMSLAVVRIADACALVAEFYWIGRSARSAHFDLCPKCEYDLTGNESRVCPECGLRLPGRRARD